MRKVLIAYVTKTNTTKEAAQEIGRVLNDRGFSTDILPMSEVRSVAEYGAAILGAPINGMQWHPDASAFVTAFQNDLQNMPTSYFLVSYLLITGREFWKKAIRASLDKVSALVKPFMTGMFGGRVEITFPAVPRFLFGVKKDAPIDVTDFGDVRKWAEQWVENRQNASISRDPS